MAKIINRALGNLSKLSGNVNLVHIFKHNHHITLLYNFLFQNQIKTRLNTPTDLCQVEMEEVEAAWSITPPSHVECFLLGAEPLLVQWPFLVSRVTVAMTMVLV